MRGSLSWWLMRPFRVAAGLWRRDPEYLAQLGLAKRPNAGAEASSAGGDRDDPAVPLVTGSSGERCAEWSVREFMASTYPDLAGLGVYVDPTPLRTGRLTLLLESLNSLDVLGTGATALLFAVALARHRGVALRLVTRQAPPDAPTCGSILSLQGWRGTLNTTFEYAPAREEARRLAIVPGETMLTTSWRTTMAALKVCAPDRILYLIQDDERLRCRTHDERLRCTEILCHPQLRFVVNSRGLFTTLEQAGMQGVAERGLVFEPAFPEPLYARQARRPLQRRRFILDAAPGDPLGLFPRGLEVLAAVLEQEILTASDWDIEIIGADLPNLRLPRGVQPRTLDPARWREHLKSIRQADLALVLSARHAPAYAALALAAAGAVVVTNATAINRGLPRQCARIQVVEPTIAALSAALAEGRLLVETPPERIAHQTAMRSEGGWETAFAPVLDALDGS